MDLSNLCTAAESVLDDHVPGLKNLGNSLFRTVCVHRKSRDLLTRSVAADFGSLLEVREAASHRGKVEPSETGSVRHICRADDVSRRACVLSLFGTHASGHSRMDETAFLRENRNKDRDNCTSDSPSVDVPNVAAKREQNSMKPLMRQTSKKRGQNGICPESTILVGTSTLTTQIKGVGTEYGGGL